MRREKARAWEAVFGSTDVSAISSRARRNCSKYSWKREKASWRSTHRVAQARTKAAWFLGGLGIALTCLRKISRRLGESLKYLTMELMASAGLRSTFSIDLETARLNLWLAQW